MPCGLRFSPLTQQQFQERLRDLELLVAVLQTKYQGRILSEDALLSVEQDIQEFLDTLPPGHPIGSIRMEPGLEAGGQWPLVVAVRPQYQYMVPQLPKGFSVLGGRGGQGQWRD